MANENTDLIELNDDLMLLAYENVRETGRWPKACEYIEDELIKLKNAIFSATPGSYEIEKWRKMVFLTAGCMSEMYQEEHLAISLLEKGLQLDPENPHFKHMLGTVYFRLGDDHKVEQEFEELLADPDSIDELWYKGNAGAVSAKLAIAKFRIAAPDAGNQRPRLEDAKRLLIEANQIEGLQNISPLRHGQLAYIEMALNNIDLAISEFKTAIKLSSQNSTVWDDKTAATFEAEYTMGLGQTIFLYRDKEQGLKLMDKAIRIAKNANNTPLIQSLEAIYQGTINRKEADTSEIDTGKIKNATPLEHHEIKELKE